MWSAMAVADVTRWIQKVLYVFAKQMQWVHSDVSLFGTSLGIKFFVCVCVSVYNVGTVGVVVSMLALHAGDRGSSPDHSTKSKS